MNSKADIVVAYAEDGFVTVTYTPSNAELELLNSGGAFVASFKGVLGAVAVTQARTRDYEGS